MTDYANKAVIFCRFSYNLMQHGVIFGLNPNSAQYEENVFLKSRKP